ncbi:type III secretion system ATPase, FliI/YscN [Terriglobus roseus DSM 18391]|uniref:Flagellum-specific ATP synthase n=1 Tax=Terriglobus roseus (strain DSM 18391 / NRRL B-41598 / KBS 63) TaxID=926566 RepID=I3ZFV4_TERRK|nr:FliI/YscN family ATPase [Terriglobus roseus]AFL88122.1 type III secretion system ATPase, FliI/YscN [Terriglobus roseus DSM 18391]
MALESYFSHLKTSPFARLYGEVVEANGSYVQSLGPPCSIGDCCEIHGKDGTRHMAEVIGFRAHNVLAMPLSSGAGIRFGDRVFGSGTPASLSVGMAMLGRVLDANGHPIDGYGAVLGETLLPLDRNAPMPLERTRMLQPISVGVRAIDAMMTVARGQRIGIFGGSGVGKSTLIGMMTRNTAADLTVVGLVGERGREVGEFLEDSLGEEGRSRSVVHVSTSDESPLMRMRCALAATTTAEYFAARGKHVLLILDSLTRYAMAAREIGLAAGEPPSTKGYPPSVFAKMARLLERAGNFSNGSITAFYTVLMEGDDEQDPIVDGARSILDGHIILSREIAGEGRYPPIDILRSLSRLMPAVASESHQLQARAVRRMLSAYARGEDLLRVGAYKAGSDLELDQAIALRPLILKLLTQATHERHDLNSSVQALNDLTVLR